MSYKSYWLKGKTSSGKTSRDGEELEPTLSQAPGSFRGYVTLFHPRIHENALLRVLARFPCSRHPLWLGEVPLGPSCLECPFPGHLLAFPRGLGQGQGPAGETSPLLGVTFRLRRPRQQNKSEALVSTEAGGGESCPVQFSTPARAGGSQLGRGHSLKIKNYSLASLHGGKQKATRSHRRLFSAPSTPSAPAGWPAPRAGCKHAPPRPMTHTDTLHQMGTRGHGPSSLSPWGCWPRARRPHALPRGRGPA